MFVSSDDYEKAVVSVVQESGEVLVAVAFWGAGAEALLLRRSGAPTRIICNLRAGGTNPAVIEKLRGKNGMTVKQHDRLHAKVLVGRRKAVVGSANLSSNGLNLERNELKGWLEAGLITENRAQIKATRKWFDSIWRSARDIHDQDVADAKAKWKKRRHERPLSGTKFALEDLTFDELHDRRAVLIIYTDCHLSKEAKNACREEQERLINQAVADKELWPCYEGWETLPKETQLIDIYCGPRGGLSCVGVYTRTPERDIEFTYEDGSEGHLAVVRKESEVMGLRFGRKEAQQLTKLLRPHIREICKRAEGDEGGKVISLADVVKVIKSG